MTQSSIWVPYVLNLLFRFAYSLLEVPTVRMIEYAICHRQVDEVKLDVMTILSKASETSCKAAAIQGQVASTVGWKMSFDAIPGVYAVPLWDLAYHQEDLGADE